MSDSSPAKARPRIVGLLYLREMRDQFRDRRTIFSIIVLPMVLYPLLGSLLMQVAQFARPQHSTIAVIGYEHLPSQFPLFDQHYELVDEYADLVAQPTKWLFQSTIDGSTTGDNYASAQSWVLSGGIDAVAYIDQVSDEDRERVRIQVVHDASSGTSKAAADGLGRVLGKWNNDICLQEMKALGIEPGSLSPLSIEGVDVGADVSSGHAFWSKLLPFVMLVWALTGAFYPAVDLVAGEKERGTLETLLCSPTLRSEIVLGKMFAVASFSILTAVLNVISMLITGMLVAKSFFPGGDGGTTMSIPPFFPLLWLWIALIPLAFLFSALALAVASLARSSKEGQYYLMPLMMLALPLVMLPMMPGVDLNIGTSLIPVTGMFLLARDLIEGNYSHAILYLPFVTGITGGCLLLAVRWAAKQFEDESVLFRGGEHWSFSGWVRHLKRDREGETTVGLAYTCAAFILVGLFFARLVAQESPASFAALAKAAFVPQFGLILAPALIMACGFTKSITKSLALRWPGRHVMFASVIIGVCLHPTYLALGSVIRKFFPISEDVEAALGPFEGIVSGAPWWSVLLVLALLPAVCEEIAFRGFIFTGLKRNDGGGRAIIVTSLLFGLSHGVLQQSIAATFMGCVLGWVVLKTGSILPTIVIHLINNSLSVSMGRLAELQSPQLHSIIFVGESGAQYQWGWMLMAAGIGMTACYYLALRDDFKEVTPDESSATGIPPITTMVTPSAAN